MINHRTIKQNYKQFLNDNFEGLRIRSSLFFNWDNGLRFDLQKGEVDTGRYFEEVFKRSTTLFQAAFAPNDSAFLVIMDYKYKRAKIRSGNFCFKQIRDLSGHEIAYLKVHKLYDPNDSLDVRNVTVVKSDIERIDYKNILKAIGNTDFTQRQPRLDKNGVFTSKEVFFLNIDKKLIFHMYDDRGLDIIANDVEQLRPIYNKFNSWLLDSNREKIDGLFNKEKQLI